MNSDAQEYESTDNSDVSVEDGVSMPRRGTLTGINVDTYDCDLGEDATNAQRSLVGDTKSDIPLMWSNDNCKNN